MDNSLSIRPLEMNHIGMIIEGLVESDINRSEDYFKLCLLENELNKRVTLLAFFQKEFAGYINIIFNSRYPYFYKKRIPEISDFFVLPEFRKKGIGTKLLQAAERAISNTYNRDGLGVGLYVDYGSAQKLYLSNGYHPDVTSISALNNSSSSSRFTKIDDELMVYLFKRLN
jgi:GNAT superfamily N-acetyltransferase